MGEGKASASCDERPRQRPPPATTVIESKNATHPSLHLHLLLFYSSLPECLKRQNIALTPSGIFAAWAMVQRTGGRGVYVTY